MINEPDRSEPSPLQPWPLERTDPEPSRCHRWTVIVPVVVGTALGGLLGTLGFFGLGFGMGSACTDFNEAPHACGALYTWLAAGFIGQWALVATGVLALVVSLRVPRVRLQMAVAGWAIAPISVAWFCLYFYGGYHSYKH